MRMLNRHTKGLASALMSHLLTIDHQSSQGMDKTPTSHFTGWCCVLPCFLESWCRELLINFHAVHCAQRGSGVVEKVVGGLPLTLPFPQHRL